MNFVFDDLQFGYPVVQVNGLGLGEFVLDFELTFIGPSFRQFLFDHGRQHGAQLVSLDLVESPVDFALELGQILFRIDNVLLDFKNPRMRRSKIASHRLQFCAILQHLLLDVG